MVVAMVLATNITSEGYLWIAIAVMAVCAFPFVGLGMLLETLARPKLVTWAKRLSVGLLMFSVVMLGWAGIPKLPDLGMADVVLMVAIFFPGAVGALALWRDRKARSKA